MIKQRWPILEARFELKMAKKPLPQPFRLTLLMDFQSFGPNFEPKFQDRTTPEFLALGSSHNRPCIPPNTQRQNPTNVKVSSSGNKFYIYFNNTGARELVLYWIGFEASLFIV